MAGFTLVVGNKNYSSWSLRPWLAMRQAGIAFEEVVIPLYQAGSKAALLAHSPAGKVPVLRHGDRVVWDSLAIMEYLAETFPAAGLWPEDAAARALARSDLGRDACGLCGLARRHADEPARSAARPEAQRRRRRGHRARQRDLARLPGAVR